MTEPDITQPIIEICNALDLEANNVAGLNFTPGTVEATIMLLNDNGSKYINDGGDIATETRTFKVKS